MVSRAVTLLVLAPVAATCSAILDFDIADSTLLANDLGGTGPNPSVKFPGAPQSITFQWPAGPTITIKNSSTYEPGPASVSRNGKKGKVGAINVRGGTCVDLVVSIGIPPHADLAYYFSILDFDGMFIENKAANKETVTIDGFREYFVDPKAKMEISQNKNGSMTITSIQAAGTENDPTDPTALTATQMLNAITFLFDGQAEFNMRFCVEGSDDPRGRDFLFSGTTPLVTTTNPICQGSRKVVESQAMFDFTASKVEISDLGGTTRSMRFDSVGNIRGRPVDLLIKAENEYIGAAPNVNGLQGHFGIINVRNNASVDLLFTFVDSDTSEEIAISTFYFGFFDFDQLPSGEGREVVTVHEKKLNYRVAANSKIQVTRRATETEFKSTTVGNRDDNPTDPLDMTDAQKEKGMVIFLRERSSFRATLSVEGGPENDGRNFEFAGFAPTVDPTCGRRDQVESVVFDDRQRRKFLSAAGSVRPGV